MANFRDIKGELSEMQVLHYITDAYAEISAMRIARAREPFEHSSEFFIQISSLYQQISILAAKKGYLLQPAEKAKKRAAVAFTSNRHFFGKMNADILERFLEDTDENEADKVVVGRTGREYFRQLARQKEVIRFSVFKKDYPGSEETRDLLNFLADYDEVLLYYPKFVTSLRQEVGVMDITFTPRDLDLKEFDLDYLFEPELPEMLKFFKRQIRAVLFTQTMLEAELSRTASRLVAMNEARDRAKDLIKQKKYQLKKIERSLQNARLIETVIANKKQVS